MENLNNNQETKPRVEYNTPNHLTVNVPPPSGLTERIASHTNNPKSKTTLIISVVILLVILGVGGWWYYAQGQVWFMLKQAKWDWGSANLENYQQKTVLSLEVRNRNNNEQNMYAMFFGGDKFDINVVNDQKNIGVNAESNIDISAKTTDFNLDLGLDAVKIDNKMYLKFDIQGIEDILSSIVGSISSSDNSMTNTFNDTWFEMDIEESYNISLDKDRLAKLNVEFNNFLQELKDEKVFAFQDLKEDDRGYRKIQLNIKEDKIDIFVISTLNYVSKFYDVVLEEGDVSNMYKQSNEERIKEFEKMKTEKPEDWEKLKQMFKSVSFTILINPDTKNIHGWELNLNNLELDSGASSTIFNGNINYFIEAIDYYEINKPTNTKSIEDLTSMFMSSANVVPEDTMMVDLEYNDLMCGEYTDDKEKEYCYRMLELRKYIEDETDTDADGLLDSLEENIFYTNKDNSDTDGDGYSDFEEVHNKYNPNGEGVLDSDMIGFLEFVSAERSEAQANNVMASLKQLVSTTVVCQDENKNIQYVSGEDCDGTSAPIVGESLCSEIFGRWPDLTNYGFIYTPCSSDYKNGFWEYGATNGEITIICDNDNSMGCIKY